MYISQYNHQIFVYICYAYPGIYSTKTFQGTRIPVKKCNVFSSFSKQIILHTFKFAVLNQNHCHFKHCCCSCISVAICVLQVLLTSNRLIGRGVNIRCHLLELTLTPLKMFFFQFKILHKKEH